MRNAIGRRGSRAAENAVNRVEPSPPRKPGWTRFTDDSLDAVAYYVRATQRREQRGLPCIGVCTDRRQQAQVAEAVHSDNIKSYVCLCCAQLHTYARNWECACDCTDNGRQQRWRSLRRARIFA